MAGILGRLTGRNQERKVASGAAAAAAAAAQRRAAAPPVRTINPADYGMPERAQLRTDLPVNEPALDAAITAVQGGDWRPAAALFATAGRDWERRYLYTTIFAEQAANEDAWLLAWRQAHPQDAAAATVQARAVVDLAWQVRTSDRAENVTRDQWDGFFRVLSAAPDACREAAALAPEDPTPWAVMLPTAMGLQWPHDDFRAIWAEVVRRAPQHVKAHMAAQSYWLPRWYGSRELMIGFTETAIAAAPQGSLLTMLRLDLLNNELRPDDVQERPAFWKSDQVRWAVDEALADLAAADPRHLRIDAMRSWLARFLTVSGRYAEAVEQFRLMGPSIANLPWTYSSDRTSLFITTRTNAVLGWEDAGRPPLPGVPLRSAPPVGSYFSSPYVTTED